jgi:hypothetical protein
MVEYDKYRKSDRQSRNDKLKDKNNSFFGTQKHIRIKLNKIEKRVKSKSSE